MLADIYKLVSLSVTRSEVEAPSGLAEYVARKTALMPTPRRGAPTPAAASPRAGRTPALPAASRRARAANARNMRRMLPVACVVLLMFVLKARMPGILSKQENTGGAPPSGVYAEDSGADTEDSGADTEFSVAPDAPQGAESAKAGSGSELTPAAAPERDDDAIDAAWTSDAYKPAPAAEPQPDAYVSDVELYGAVTVTGELPELLAGRAMLLTDYGVYTLLATRDEADRLVAMGYEASLTGALSQGAVAIILYAPG
jgi:hypothetical protein